MTTRNIHKLKIWPTYFNAVYNGFKDFEHRINDRNYQIGDVLILQEYNPDTNEYTGKELSKRIKYISALDNNYVILGIVNICDNPMDELLLLLEEETAELLQSICKTKRFPTSQQTIENVAAEISDVATIIELIKKHSTVLCNVDWEELRAKKLDRLKLYSNILNLNI